MINNQDDILTVHINVEMPATALKTIVENAKKLAGSDPQGRPMVDTAGAVSMMVTKFLAEMDFEAYVTNPGNYPKPETR